MKKEDLRLGDWFIGSIHGDVSIYHCAWTSDASEPYHFVNMRQPTDCVWMHTTDNVRIIRMVDNPFCTESFNELLEQEF